MFRTVTLSTINSSSLYTHNSECHTGSLTACEQDQDGSCSQAVSKPVWHIPLLCLQWKTPDEGQRNCPKHVELYSKINFEKLVRLFWFYYKNMSRCTVTWTSNKLVHLFWFYYKNMSRCTVTCTSNKLVHFFWFYYKNMSRCTFTCTSNKLVHLFWFYYKNMSRCTVTCTSNKLVHLFCFIIKICIIHLYTNKIALKFTLLKTTHLKGCIV